VEARVCGAFRWHLGLMYGRHRRRDCVLRAVEALRGRLKALWAVMMLRCEGTHSSWSSDESSCTSFGRAAVADQRTAPSWTTRPHCRQSSCRFAIAETVDRSDDHYSSITSTVIIIRPSGVYRPLFAQATTPRIDQSQANTAGPDIPEHSTTRLYDTKHVLARSDALL